MDHELLGNRDFHRQRRNLTANRGTVRPSFYFSVPSVWFNWGNQNFQQGAFVRRDGYVYSFGTPSGRSGSAYVSRVPENAVLDLSQYEYWSNPWWNFFGTGSWVANSPWAATPVISAPVSEMSVQYNDYLNKYVALYTDGSQQRRDANSGQSTRTVERIADPGDVNTTSWRHLRTVPPPLVDRPRPLLQPLAVVGVQRNVDAHYVPF